MGAFFTDDEAAIVAAAADRLLPPDPELGAVGGAAGGVVAYVDTLLGAFTFDPPRVWAGGPFSGRNGGDADFDRWLRLRALDELAWRIRIEGSLGLPEREFNGPVIGWQERYRAGVAALGSDFASVDGVEQDRRLDSAAEFTSLLYDHACEATYGDPVYGGNRGSSGWQFIGFPGDSQPRGYTDTEVGGGEVGGGEVGGTEVGGTEVGGTEVGGTEVGGAEVGSAEVGGAAGRST